MEKANSNLGRPFILASCSPRRKELLSQIISDFEIVSSDAQELKLHEGGFEELVQEKLLEETMRCTFHGCE